MVLVLSEINFTLLKERMKSGQNYTKNQPLRTPEGLISRTQLKNSCWTWNFGILCVHIMTLSTNFKRNRPTFISKSAPVSQAEALKFIGVWSKHLRVFVESLQQSSQSLVIFRNVRKMFGNVCVTFRQVLENLWKSSQSGQKSLENCQKCRHQFNKLTSVFHASVLLLIMNFVITLSK